MHLPVAQLIEREGALPPNEVIRWLAEACDALARMSEGGTWSGIGSDNLSVSRDPAELATVEPTALPSQDRRERAQVEALGALGYLMVKGQPPPVPLTEEAFAGLHTDFARLLAGALQGNGAATASALAAELRRLRLPSQVPPRRNSDTVLKVRASSAGDRTGEQFGQFELVRLLGEGGMGDVYLARHMRLARDVAIKVLKPEFAAMPDLVQRFFQEANVVNEIRHPHIVQVQDFVEEPGRVYCVMELLEGMNLADLAEREGPLSLGRVCFLVAQVCDALHAAHLREVVHRDIKPENVFISRGPDGADFARVLDFGIARRAASGTRTQAGAVMGTPQYMAPEQAAGRSVDARADLYSVGVMLFELLAHQSIASVGNPVPPERDGVGTPLPVDVKALMISLLSIDPDRRPGSADEVRVKLLPHATGQGGSLPPGTPVRVSGIRPATSVAMAEAGLVRRSWTPIVGLGVGLLVVAGVVGWLATRGSPAGAQAATPPPRVEPVKPEVKPEVKPDPPVPPDTVAVPAPPDTSPPAVPPAAPEGHQPTRASPDAPAHPVTPSLKPPKKGSPAVAKGPRKVEPPGATPPSVDAETKRRFDAVKRRYFALLNSPAGKKLTAQENANCQLVLDAEVKGLETLTAETLSQAEEALEAAEVRVGK